MRLKEYFFVKKLFGVLMLPALLAGCNDSTLPPIGSPPPSTPPLVLSLSSPARLADYDAATFLVSDYAANAIHFTDKQTLAITRSIRVSGQPTGVAHAGGLLFVGNKTTGSVDVLDVNGEFQFRLDEQTGIFPNVLDVAIDVNTGLVYVLNSSPARIDVYDQNGVMVQSDLTSGNGPDDLVSPAAIALGPNSQIYVSDYGVAGDFNDQSVKVYDSAGGIVASITSGGGFFSAPSFFAPQGLHVDASGNIFMTDSGASVVFVFNSSLVFEKQLSVRGTQAGEVFYPLDVLIDENTRDVFIADNRNGRITALIGQGVVP